MLAFRDLDKDGPSDM